VKCTNPNYHTHPQNLTHISSPKTPEVSREAPPTVIANPLVRKYAKHIIPNSPVARMQCIMKVETRNSNQNKCPIKKRTEVLNFLSLCILNLLRPRWSVQTYKLSGIENINTFHRPRWPPISSCGLSSPISSCGLSWGSENKFLDHELWTENNLALF
jgi:hypothetical protein